MSQRTQHHQEQEPNTHLVAKQNTQAPVHQQESPAKAAQRAMNAPASAHRPSDILALQQTVGNRAVQRLVESSQGAVQRHVDPQLTEWAGRLRAQVNLMGDAMNRSGHLNLTEATSQRTARKQFNKAGVTWHEKFPR